MVTFERKSMPIVAWYILSNESYINRVIRDVLPTVTLVPRSTSASSVIPARNCIEKVGRREVWYGLIWANRSALRERPVLKKRGRCLSMSFKIPTRIFRV